MTISRRQNTPASRAHTAARLSRNPRKTVVFITFGVGVGIGISVVLRLFVLLTDTQPKYETPTETQHPVSPRVFPRLFSTPQDSLKDFQKSEFYRTIVDNNLFRPLGWTPPRPREPYRLIGTFIPTAADTPKQAILQTTAGERRHTVTIGERLDAATTVVDIQPKEVTLQRDGRKTTLRLTPQTFLNAKRRRAPRRR